MSLERERKFLFIGDESILEKPASFGTTPLEIEQGYLISDSTSMVRVRITETSYNPKQPFRNKLYKSEICYKNFINKTDRNEFEFKIPNDDAQEMMALCKYKLIKVRHVLFFNRKPVYVDVYPDGLKVVEIEYENELLESDIPDFCGEDITDNKELSNYEIAKRQTSNDYK